MVVQKKEKDTGTYGNIPAGPSAWTAVTLGNVYFFNWDRKSKTGHCHEDGGEDGGEFHIGG